MAVDRTLLIAVDEEDRPIGPISREQCHRGEGRLHRAFSVFLTDHDGRVLLQQRSAGKRLWPGAWSNSCCSHPRWGEEDLAESARGRVMEELRLALPQAPRRLFGFVYHAHDGHAGSEHEYCHVYHSVIEHIMPRPDPDEVQALRWLSPDALDDELAKHPAAYSPWLHLEWPRLRECLSMPAR